ncbi:DUF4349 domain-containing protein [Actinoplanes sp. TBRC 11911]|uniref:DUF4349 domain-containing protein n=1 Tax=Actinoplanes sp. TBRC 11911 TaxID=2729386 RepID=UPI0028A28C99|nr:DUF4349 domain-containing protein [Actinoplanes sp. TBRC 11911]
MSTALIVGLLVGGCTGNGQTDQAASSGAGVSNAMPEAPAAGVDTAQGAAEGKDTPAQAPDLSVDQRSIIYRGSLSVRVQDVNAAASQTSGIVQTAGGYVGGDNRSSGGSGADTATMELRVPAAKFTAFVDQLAKQLSGTEEQRQISTEDVTEQTVDLDARITVQQARVDSGRRLLAQAKSLNDLVMLEKEVATRESDLASLQAKKRHLADLTALSTITVTLLGPQAAVLKADDGPAGFLGGLAGGWKALVSSLAVVLTVLGAVLPWVLAIGVPALLVWWLIRRARPGKPALVPAGPPATVQKADGPDQG